VLVCEWQMLPVAEKGKHRLKEKDKENFCPVKMWCVDSISAGSRMANARSQN